MYNRVEKRGERFRILHCSSKAGRGVSRGRGRDGTTKGQLNGRDQSEELS